jgi:hypothetical protein
MPNPSTLPVVAIAPAGPVPHTPSIDIPDPAQVPHRDPEPGSPAPQQDPQPDLPKQDPEPVVPMRDPQPELPLVDPPVIPVDPTDPQPQTEYV